MKNKIVIVLISLSVLLIIYELVSVDLHLYRSQCNNQSKSEWKKIKSISRISNSNEEIPDSHFAIVVKHDSTIIGDVGSVNPICIDISNADFGAIWMPFYKKSKYSISTSVEDEHVYKTDSTTFRINIEGKINVLGEYKIIGLCTYRKARGLIIEKVMNDVYESAKQKIN